ncbi:MAG: hypothetical protein ACXW16_01705 [Burkholderiaceae bacterium]
MLVNKTVDREWKPTETSGVERSLFRTNDAGGRSSVVRLRKQARVPRHAQTATKKWSFCPTVLIGGVELGEGHYLFTQPGEEQDVVALTDAVIFVSSQKSVTLVE